MTLNVEGLIFGQSRCNQILLEGDNPGVSNIIVDAKVVGGMSNRDILQEIDAVIAHEAARRVVNKSREIVDGLITP